VRIKGEDYCLQENIDLLFAYPLPFYGLRLCKRSYLCVFLFFLYLEVVPNFPSAQRARVKGKMQISRTAKYFKKTFLLFFKYA